MGKRVQTAPKAAPAKPAAKARDAAPDREPVQTPQGAVVETEKSAEPQPVAALPASEEAAAPLTLSADASAPADQDTQPEETGLIEQQPGESPAAATNQPAAETSTPPPATAGAGEAGGNAKHKAMAESAPRYVMPPPPEILRKK
jgi:hypothetical protein